MTGGTGGPAPEPTRPWRHLPETDLRSVLAMTDHDGRHALASHELACRIYGADRVRTTPHPRPPGGRAPTSTEEAPR